MGGKTSVIIITAELDKFVIRGNTKPVKEDIKLIPGYRWNPMRKCWTVPKNNANKVILESIRDEQRTKKSKNRK